MRALLCLILSILVPVFSWGHDRCDRDKIRKALLAAKNSPEAEAFSKLPRGKVLRPARQNLMTVFRKVEKSVFGRHLLRIQEDLPMIPPMSSMNLSTGTISVSPQTLDSLNRKLTHPPDGAAFIIAHEIAHFVQEVSFHHDPKKLSPNGFPEVTASGDQEAFNQLHAETDCIAVEILHQAGYPLSEDIFKTLQIIKEECKTQRETSFCNSADDVRQATVRTYLQQYSPHSKAKTAAPPPLHRPHPGVH